ncbi:MAG: S8 family serine peptidase [Halobacteriales archaeon]|nr:S8 family serine peptidase [Halobacteriales archaeon]
MRAPARSIRRPVTVVVLLIILTASLSGCIAESDWALRITGIDKLHQQGLKGQGVKVAIIDTGIDGTHGEFKGLRVIWKDVVNGRTTPYDDSEVGHGTHVAGIIAAQGDLAGEFINGVHVQGAAPAVSLIIVKAVKGDGEGSDQDVASAVQFAMDAGADIITMSLGGTSGRRLLVGTDTENAVNDALNRGIVVIAAAGNKENPNDTNDDVATPASVNGVIAVGAVDKDKRIAAFSYKGDNAGSLVPPRQGRADPNKKPEVVAPGVQIVSAAREGRYAIADGTSQATPFVAAAVALMLQAHPEFKRGGARGGTLNAVNQIKSALAESAEKIGPLSGSSGFSHDDVYGYGLLRADVAVQRL